jgi:hypothetical protein
LSLPRCAVGLPVIGIPPGWLPDPTGAAADVALTLVAGNAEPTGLNAGAAEVQPCGTESIPSWAARPTLAVIWALLIPDMPNMPVPELKPLPTANPNVWKWLPNRPAVGPTDCMSEPADMPKVDIDATEPLPDARPESAMGNEVAAVHDDSDDEDDVDVVAEASAGSTSDPAAVVSGADIIEPTWLDITELSWLDITELSWPDSRELNSVDIIELIWDSMELSGVDIRELSWLDSRELACDAV